MIHLAFDFKKEYKEYYLPKNRPSIVNIPTMNYIAISGRGDPNDEDGEYHQAMELLYPLAYTIKMSKLTDHRMKGYFDYVVPPLEGLWWNDADDPLDFSDKGSINWISIIRLPDFVTPEEFQWAKEQVSEKKDLDTSKAEFLTLKEGLCAQCMHVGSYDEQDEVNAMLVKSAEDSGYRLDITDERRHHEIYLSDPRRVEPSKLKTVLRLPIAKS